MHSRSLFRLSPFLLLTALSGGPSLAQDAAHRAEISHIKDPARLPDLDRQAELRRGRAWRTFKVAHPRWSVEFNEVTGAPRRAYGNPVLTTGATAEQRAISFLENELQAFGLPVEDLVPLTVAPTKKLTYVHFEQVHEGLPVLGARAMVKLNADGQAIAFGADLVREFNVATTPSVGVPSAVENAANGLVDVLNSEHLGVRYLALNDGRGVALVHEVMVNTRTGERPGRYRCLVNAHTGVLEYRSNEVVSCDHVTDEADAGADVTMTGLAYTGSPLMAPQVQPLPHIDVTVGGTLFRTDAGGFLASGVPGPVNAVYQLRGRWANVSTGGVTPSFTGTLSEGTNSVTFGNPANVRERSAYIYTNQIHDHMKTVLPDFVGMDQSLPVFLDLTTDNCNAFYDGSSINFYAEANNCRSLATINDVVYHEYGHGINDRFYLSQSGTFSNGAMNEGYADVWALTLTQNPVLGLGINLDNDNSTVRRYDQTPKVYPVDIVGEVHSDGEIICGAWWDTYVLLGFDMPLTLDLFAAAYPGLQAFTFNGNEGEAFRDVLLDVLQADDDDGDITNGTMHGEAIVDAFGMHGITLISDAELYHDGILSAPAEVPIELLADLIITFPSTEYLEEAAVFYRVNGGTDWNELLMTTSDGSEYEAQIPAQPVGTVVAYYIGLRDIYGQSSSITPIGANRVDPGLPFYAMVGYEVEATENADDLNELGVWEEGQPEDNAVTGLWEFGPPVASYSDVLDPGTICQTGTQHTEDGEFCWFTGNAANITVSIGENDVDDGSTTLLGPNIDLSAMSNPAISYWRWYTNNPPTGANPNTDWWQVYASADDGDTWVPVEDTKSGERNWRRKVFRVQDVLGDVNSIRLKFIASDSVRAEQELEGGSLVEAALDDIELWEQTSASAVDEAGLSAGVRFWPTPASAQLTVELEAGSEGSTTVEVLDMTGRSVKAAQPITDRLVLDVSGLANGQYALRVRWPGGHYDRAFSVVR